MTYRQYSKLRRSNTPEAVTLIRNMDSLQREVYERAFRHMVEHERKMLGKAKSVTLSRATLNQKDKG